MRNKEENITEPQEVIPFCFALRYRIEEKTGMNWHPYKRKKVVKWLAEMISVTPMSAGRYLRGRSIPIPKIAVRISELLNWNYYDLVQSIIIVEKTNLEQKYLRKYSEEQHF